MKSGRGFGGILSGAFPKEAYKIGRGQWFSCITDSGDLVPTQNVRVKGEGGADWATLRAALTLMKSVEVTPFLSVWTCNIDGPYANVPEITREGMQNFFSRLVQEMDSLQIPKAFFCPAWEFNQTKILGIGNAEWGLGVANSPRHWGITPEKYNQAMQNLRAVCPSNITLAACPHSRHTAIIYPGTPQEAWNGWEGRLGGKAVLDPYLPGLRAAPVTAPTFYYNLDFLNDKDVMEQLALKWLDNIRALINPPRFGLSEYNVHPYNTTDSPTFIENSYELLHKHGFEFVIWWVPFVNPGTLARCNELALEYYMLQQQNAEPEPAEVGKALLFLLASLGWKK